MRTLSKRAGDVWRVGGLALGRQMTRRDDSSTRPITRRQRPHARLLGGEIGPPLEAARRQQRHDEQEAGDAAGAQARPFASSTETLRGGWIVPVKWRRFSLSTTTVRCLVLVFG